MEAVNGDFTFIVDTVRNTAKLIKIYIPLGEEKYDICIPNISYDGCDHKYTVTEVSNDSIRTILGRIKSVELPNTLAYRDSNIETIKTLIRSGIQTKKTILSVFDFYGIERC